MTVLEEARPDDLPQLCALLSFLFEQEMEFHPDPLKQESALKLLIGNPQRGRIFVIREDSLLLGMVSVQILVSTALGGDVLLLEDLVIRPDQRNRGYGSALLAAATDFARNSGYHRITLLTDTVNRNAQRFYRRHGFRASGMQPYRLLF
jgi:ribosomal protein S18 acetylase RimI-like enzyme